MGITSFLDDFYLQGVVWGYVGAGGCLSFFKLCVGQISGTLRKPTKTLNIPKHTQKNLKQTLKARQEKPKANVKIPLTNPSTTPEHTLNIPLKNVCFSKSKHAKQP